MKTDYSEKEFSMIKQLSPYWAGLIEKDLLSSITPPKVLEIIALECFMNGKCDGVAVDSLRRCVRAFYNSSPYRMTKEYDDLIIL